LYRALGRRKDRNLKAVLRPDSREYAGRRPMLVIGFVLWLLFG
jgi:hypothetical protein